MVWRAEDPQGNEAAKVRWDIVPYTRGIGADVGCGPEKAFAHFIGVDNCVDTELFGIPIKPDITIQSALDLPFNDDSLDFVFSSHLLEHIADTHAALTEWWRCLKVGGFLVLYLPHRDLYPNVGKPGANPDHKHDFVEDDIIHALRAVTPNATVRHVEKRDQGYEYSFLLVVEKSLLPPGWTWNFPGRAPEGSKTACVVRYGGFGDMIQTSNILPALKEQGYHVTMMTTPKGHEILHGDPHIDAWFLQDHDQVPNNALVEFWKHHAKRFDKFVNLSESIEGTLLTLPGRGNHQWPDAVRRREHDKNYLEWTAELAEVPYQSVGRFYPTADERHAARERLGRMRGVVALPMGVARPRGFAILWVLAGSSVHKFYPGQDVVLERLLRDFNDIHVMFVGEGACKILEVGWEKHPRVTCASGELTIRETLALAQVVDCVVGPETGVLNAVAFEPNAKVVLLSHSSVENLTKHWHNTRAMVPEVPCYPCHRLHYTREFCPEDPLTGAAVCQASLNPRLVYEAVVDAYHQKPPRPLRLVPYTEPA